MIYLDDGFFDHAKVVEAGDDAAIMFLKGLAWLKQQGSTDGLIPKSVVPRLAPIIKGRPVATRSLAGRLVDVRLWHDNGASYEVNDYVQRNAKAIQTSIRRSEAAQKRWRTADATAPPEQMQEQPGSTSKSNANADANACPVHMPQPTAIHPQPQPTAHSPQPQSSSSVRAHTTATPPAHDDDEDDLGQVFDLLARRRLDAQRADPQAPRIRRTGPWLARTTADVRAEHADHARKLLADDPTLTPEQLADLLEPDEPDSHTGPAPISADEAIARLDERHREPVPAPTGNRHPRTAS